jgi:hypothetical protein
VAIGDRIVCAIFGARLVVVPAIHGRASRLEGLVAKKDPIFSGLSSPAPVALTPISVGVIVIA